MAETILAKMAVQISANTAQMKSAFSGLGKDIKGFQADITKLGAGIAVAFGVEIPFERRCSRT